MSYMRVDGRDTGFPVDRFASYRMRNEGMLIVIMPSGKLAEHVRNAILETALSIFGRWHTTPERLSRWLRRGKEYAHCGESVGRRSNPIDNKKA